MPRVRFFGSPTDDWVSPLVVVARSLVSVGNCLPFPYVNPAPVVGTGVAGADSDLKYLAESVVTIMKLLREEMDSHTATENTKFPRVCEEFTGFGSKHLCFHPGENWSSSKFKKYLKSHGIQEEIALFTRRVADLRANATLIAAAGTRLDLAGVADEVAAVQSRINDLQNQLVGQSLAASAADDQELTRFEEDFYSLKLGDIHLDFRSALVSEFPELDHDGREKRRIGWTDYKATVNGCVRTVRVYRGSDPAESWKGFLSFLAENSPLAKLHFYCIF
ncbi:hypothetical protein B0H14DRAFT_3853226 [Mycena olivaceomarginata]|nr:hypothetical protein B0H14DRAFT_3853226 [Mycena olivaceomarginata]